MKLLHDCVRDVMLCIEENLDDGQTISTTYIFETLKDYSLKDINYTCKKLKEAGYLIIEQFIGGNIMVRDITYSGHQFLDSIRDNNIWIKTKSKISKLAGVSLPIIQQVATQMIAIELGIN